MFVNTFVKLQNKIFGQTCSLYIQFMLIFRSKGYEIVNLTFGYTRMSASSDAPFAFVLQYREVECAN
jgi:hypothetical protein